MLGKGEIQKKDKEYVWAGTTATTTTKAAWTIRKRRFTIKMNVDLKRLKPYNN